LRFDFLIHVDFVTSLSIYFAVMLPALILTLAALLYRLLFVVAGAPFEWANFSPGASPIALPIPIYPKTFAGWLQALPVGHPGFPPPYLFLRNSLLSDLLFTFLFLLTPALLRPHRASSDLPGHPTHLTL
jgi:hypothetical protein